MRDVIRVERVPDPPGDASGGPRALAAASEGPAIDGDALAAVARVADEVLPSIVARLAVSGLGELEVRQGGWHVRVRRSAAAGDPPPGPGQPSSGPGVQPPSVGAEAGAPVVVASATSRVPGVATSPAVGYFAPRPELGVGARTAQGDVIGWVDVLGIRHEVVAPADGLVGRWFVGPGDPVEYGQQLAQLVPGGAPVTRTDQGEADA